MNAFNTATLNLVSSLAHIGYGVLIIIAVTYFNRWWNKDPGWLLSMVSGVVILETIAAALRVSYAWSVMTTKDFHLHWESPIETLVRIPSGLIAQAYFCWVVYSLLGRSRFLAAVLFFVLLAEVTVGAATYLIIFLTRTSITPHPHPVTDLFLAMVIGNVMVDSILTIALVSKLRSLRSSLKSSDHAIRLIVRRMLGYIVTLVCLALLTLLLWFLQNQYRWYRVSFEALYRCYVLNFLIALLSRDTTRKLIEPEGPLFDPDEIVSAGLNSSEGSSSPLVRSGRSASNATKAIRRDSTKTVIESSIVAPAKLPALPSV